MSIVLDPVVRARGVSVAALCRVTLIPAAQRSGVSVWAEKRPLALLLRRGDTIRCLAPDGASLPESEVERLCPGVLTRFAELCDAADPSG